MTSFHDVTTRGMWINGGFFVFDRRIFDYVQEGDDLPDTLRRLIADRELCAFKYDGFWAPMDTLKDHERLEGLVRDGEASGRSGSRPGQAMLSSTSRAVASG